MSISVSSAPGPLSYIQAFCNVVVWRPPLITNGVITGYDVMFIREGIAGVPIPKDADESFHVVVDGDIPSVDGNVTVQVRHCIPSYCDLLL